MMKKMSTKGSDNLHEWWQIATIKENKQWEKFRMKCRSCRNRGYVDLPDNLRMNCSISLLEREGCVYERETECLCVKKRTSACVNVYMWERERERDERQRAHLWVVANVTILHYKQKHVFLNLIKIAANHSSPSGFLNFLNSLCVNKRRIRDVIRIINLFQGF